MSEPLCRLEVRAEGETPVVTLRGEIDLSNVADIERDIEQAIAARRAAVIVLDDVGYLDSAAIAALERLSHRGADLHVVLDKQAPIHRALTVAGLDQIIPFHSTLSEALG